MTRLFVIRHGETNWNREGRVLGRLPGNHLNEKGRLESVALAEALSTQGIRAVYTSPLERATETAAILCRRFGLREPIIEEGLNEVDAGDWAGRTREEMAGDPVWLKAHHNPVGIRLPNGEELGEAAARAVAAVELLVQRHTDETFAVVTHGDIIRSIVGSYMRLPLEHALRVIFDTASASLIECKGDTARVIRTGWKAEGDKFPLASAFGD